MRSIGILAGLVAIAGAAAPASAAENIDQLDQLVQIEFRRLSADLAGVLSYKGVVPAEPLGLTGFDIGVEVTSTSLRYPAAWDRASSGNVSSTIYVPKIHLHKGLPGGVDVGAFYASVPDGDIELWGAELRHALIPGGVATPAVGLRATYTRLQGVEQLDYSTYGAELTVSKGFAFVTPYAGIGQVWIESEPRGVSNVTAEKFSEGKVFAGVNINFGIGNTTIEADRTGETTSYSAKLGFRF